MIIKFINGSKEGKVNIKEKMKRKLGGEGGGTTFFWVTYFFHIGFDRFFSVNRLNYYLKRQFIFTHVIFVYCDWSETCDKSAKQQQKKSGRQHCKNIKTRI